MENKSNLSTNDVVKIIAEGRNRTNLFKDSEQVGTVQFTDEDCVRNPIIPYLLDKIKEIE